MAQRDLLAIPEGTVGTDSEVKKEVTSPATNTQQSECLLLDYDFPELPGHRFDAPTTTHSLWKLGTAALGASMAVGGMLDLPHAWLGDELVLLSTDLTPTDTRRPTIAQWYEGVVNQLMELTTLEPGWHETSPPPSIAALTNAIVLATQLGLRGIKPYLVGPMADGGVFFRFKRGARRAEVDVDNDGDFIASFRQSSEHRSEIFEETDPEQLVVRLQRFIRS